MAGTVLAVWAQAAGGAVPEPVAAPQEESESNVRGSGAPERPPAPPAGSWAETLARMNAEWQENCSREGFEPEGPVVVQVGSVEALSFVGEEITLPVRIKGVCDLAGGRLGVQLDRYVAELVRVEPMPFLAGDPPVDLEFQGLPPGGESHVVAIARPPGMPGVHGIGTLVRLVIRARHQGVTQIRVVRPLLQDSRGDLIETRTVPVRLTVMEAAARRGRPFERRRSRP